MEENRWLKIVIWGVQFPYAISLSYRPVSFTRTIHSHYLLELSTCTILVLEVVGLSLALGLSNY